MTEPTTEPSPIPSIPRWRLLQKSPMDRGDGFLHMFEAGTIFESRALPGVHWQPLNDSAVSSMNDWLDEKVEVLNKDFEATGKYVSRRAVLGMPNSPIRLAGTKDSAVPPPESRIVAVPDRKQTGGMEYAQARFAQATPYEVPPASVPEAFEDGEARFLHVAEPAPRGPGDVPVPAVRRA